MCGICGYSSLNRDEADKYRNLLDKMQKSMVHRGPDDMGIFQEDNIGLCHRRLSIIDLSNKGHQPMEYMERYIITYNGEIYNYIELREELVQYGYHFDTSTDTEVLLAAYDYWQEKCLLKLNGMWAFAIWDRKNETIFCARDRFGVKPFYYHINEERFLFASEIKTLLCDDTIKRVANNNIVYDYITQGLVEHTEETFFEGINKLPASTYLLIKNGQIIKKAQYYDVKFSRKIEGRVTKEDIQNFDKSFKDAVKLRLRADVPVGSCLSGGLDSSSIVCCVDELLKVGKKTEQHTFSFCTEDKRIDERKYMQAVTNATDTIAHQVFSNDDGLKEELMDLIYTQDEPFSSTGMYASYCVYRDAKRNGVTVLLDGQGADEILCGYRKSRVYYIKQLFAKRKYLSGIKEGILSATQFKSSMFIKNDIDKIRRIIFSARKKTDTVSYLKRNFCNRVKGYDYERRKDFQHNDVFVVSLPALLRYADRNSMAFSVESRLPFLDYKFVEFCAKQPISKKLCNGTSKYIMRKALKMPEIVRKRKDKIGFATPEDAWLKDNSDYFKSIFQENRVYMEQVIDYKSLLENWDFIIDKQHGAGLFRYICLELWARKFDVVCKV